MRLSKLWIIIIFPPCNFNTLDLFAFTRFCLRVLADGNGIVLGLKRDVILRKAITFFPAGIPKRTIPKWHKFSWNYTFTVFMYSMCAKLAQPPFEIDAKTSCPRTSQTSISLNLQQFFPIHYSPSIPARLLLLRY